MSQHQVDDDVTNGDYALWIATGAMGAPRPGSDRARASQAAGAAFSPPTPGTHTDNASPTVDALGPATAANAQPATQNAQPARPPGNFNWPDEAPPTYPQQAATYPPSAAHTGLAQGAGQNTYVLCPHGMLVGYYALCNSAPAPAAPAPDVGQLLTLINSQNKAISHLSEEIKALQRSQQVLYADLSTFKFDTKASRSNGSNELAGLQHELVNTKNRVGVSEYRSAVVESNLASLIPLHTEVGAIKNQLVVFEKRLTAPLPVAGATQASVAIVNHELMSIRQHVAALESHSLAVDQQMITTDWKASQAYSKLEMLRAEVKGAVDKAEGRIKALEDKVEAEVVELDKRVALVEAEAEAAEDE
ncbi:hypothetical protein Q8F55_004453 [Vanrija albida]|uniref:Uncharacterized protein n=1 Tax=Vanrija albida TaxID=181172 RepID=A0ABR3Q726_9TREE